jgi:hypothetical protein
MLARVSRLRIDPKRIDAILEQFRSETLSRFQAQEGFCGATVLVDRTGGMVLGVTFWAREEDMAASEGVGEAARTGVAAAGGAADEPVREVYEVALAVDVKPFVQAAG